MNFSVLQLLHDTHFRSCSLDLLTDAELVRHLFSFCNKSNELECKALVSDTIKHYNKKCKPHRGIVTVNVIGQVTNKRLLQVADSITPINVFYVRISYKSLGRQLRHVLKMKRNKDISNTKMTHDQWVGPTFHWEEDNGSLTLSTYVKNIIEMRDSESDKILFSKEMMKVIAIHRGNPIYEEGHEVLSRNVDKINYVYVPILSGVNLPLNNFIKINLKLLIDDFFLKSLNIDDKALDRLHRTQFFNNL